MDESPGQRHISREDLDRALQGRLSAAAGGSPAKPASMRMPPKASASDSDAPFAEQVNREMGRRLVGPLGALLLLLGLPADEENILRLWVSLRDELIDIHNERRIDP